MKTPAILVAAVLGASLVVSHLAARPQSHESPRTSWPPHPKQMVTASGVVLPGQGEKLLYTVPTDHWLVVTEAREGNTFVGCALVERINGIGTLKRSLLERAPLYYDPYSPGYSVTASGAAGIGASFQPGSQVILQLDSGGPGPAGGVEIIGYLVPTF